MLSSLLFVVLSLHVLELSSESFDLILVLIDLSLVHVELGSHCLHLTCLLLQILLIDGQLLGNLWTWLSSQEILKLNVELLLLLDDDILLDNLLSLLDQSLLKSLDLLKHFPSVWISSLKLSPSVAIEWVLKFLRESLNLKSLGQELLLKVVDLLSQVWDLRSLGLYDSKLTLVISNLELKESDVLKSLLILDLTSGKSTLKDLDLLIKKSKLIISSNELGSEDISLINDVLIVLLELLNFFVSLLDDIVEVLDLIQLLNSELFSFIVLLLPADKLTLDLLNLFGLRCLLMMLGLKCDIFGIDLVLQLSNLMGGNLELSLELGNLILGLDKILGVEISIRSNSFIQVLLLFELSFELNVFFLELTDEVLLQFDLFNHLHEIGVGLGGFVRELISILLKNIDLFEQISDVLLLCSSLLLELSNLIDLAANLILVLHVLILSLLDGLGHHVSEPDKINDLLLILFGVSPEMLDLSGESIHSVLGQVLLVLSLLLFIGDSLLVGH